MVTTMILTLLLIVFLLVWLVLSRWDLVSPTALVLYGFIMGAVALIVGGSRWHSIGSVAIFVIMLGVLSFACGEGTARIATNGLRSDVRADINMEPRLIGKLPTGVTLIALAAAPIVVWLRSQIVVEAAWAAGYRGEGYLLNYARRATHLGFDQGSDFLSIVILAYSGLAYVSIFIMLDETMAQGWRLYRLRNLVPVLPMLALGVLSTSREWVIDFLSFIIVTAFMLALRRLGDARRIAKRFVVAGLTAVIGYLMIFWLMGLLTGKSEQGATSDTILLYVGGSIPALSQFLESFHGGGAPLAEWKMIYGLASMLGRMGYAIEPRSIHLEFIDIGGGDTTNIYTAFYAYLHDLGWFGLPVIAFFTGLLFGILYQVASSSRGVLWILLYGLLSGSLVQMFISDQVWTELLTVTPLISVASVMAFAFLSRDVRAVDQDVVLMGEPRRATNGRKSGHTA